MLGAIIGDIIGSVYEFHPTKNLDFPLFSHHSTFTDDTVLTVATAKWLLDGGVYSRLLKDFTLRYPRRGYGSKFFQWANSGNIEPYNSFGNGSAMRVSPVGFSASTEKEILQLAETSAAVTHNHPEGIKGAQSVALVIFLARQGKSKSEIKAMLQNKFGYELNSSYVEIQASYRFDETCQGSVPQAIVAFLTANSFEDTIRRAVALGGDADTQACIAGGMAEAFFGEIPGELKKEAAKRLPLEFIELIDRFYRERANQNLTWK
jgi:ADP-ribosylglycohydrolase